MRTLDEAALRRPEFQGGIPIRLWDGQDWTLPRPTLAGFYPRRGPDGRFSVATGLALPGAAAGPDYNDLVDAWLDADEPMDQLGRLMELGAYLLLVNYDLADADLPLLLYRVPASDPRYDDCRAMWDAIAEVALGRGPKATPVGSGPP